MKLRLVTNYLFNQKQITQRFCENKNKPQLQCNGKCHLIKQMREQNKKEHETAYFLKDLREVFCNTAFNLSPVVPVIDSFNETAFNYVLKSGLAHKQPQVRPPAFLL